MSTNEPWRRPMADPFPLGPRRGGLRVSGGPADAVDWAFWLRHLERRRRARATVHAPPGIDRGGLATCTWASFNLDGVAVTLATVTEAIARRGGRMKVRAPSVLRLRNHASILLQARRLGLQRRGIDGKTVVRWYTAISAGLCPQMSHGQWSRLEGVTRRISLRHARLPAAIRDISSTHSALLADPVFPAFWGIMARLLLAYHLARHDLPMVTFSPERDRDVVTDPRRLVGRLLELVSEAYDEPLAGPKRPR